MTSENFVNDWVICIDFLILVGQLTIQIDRNSSKLVAIDKLQVNGANQFRDSFIESQFPTIFEPATLSETLQKLENSTKSFNILGVKSTGIDLDVNSKQSDNGPLGLIANISLESAPSRFYALKGITRDDIAGAQLILGDRNLFGGAETIELKATKFTDPRIENSVSLDFSMPISTMSRAVVSGYANASSAPWAGISEKRAGLITKIVQFRESLKFHSLFTEFGFNYGYRASEKTGLSDTKDLINGSSIPHSLKSSVFFNLKADNTDNSIFPLNGTQLELNAETANAPLIGSMLPKGDVSFLRTVVNGFYARSTDDNRITLNITGTLGHLLSLNGSTSIFDRFFLGGYKDIRGFKYNELGPRNEQYAVGGDAFASVCIKMFTKLPLLVNSPSPLRLMAFFNSCSLVSVDQTEPFGRRLGAPFTKSASTASGVGLVYKSPAAQFELVYSLPLHADETDQMDRGLKFGVCLELS